MAKSDDPQLYASGYERNRLDRYWTHPWMTYELLEHIHSDNVFPQHVCFSGPVWECAAGRGDISEAIIDWDFGINNFEVYSTDADLSEFDPNIGPGHERSFLDEVAPPLCNNQVIRSIITNPPYSSPRRGIADDFVEQGLGFFDQDVDFMAMLLRSEFKSGKSKRRRAKFGECPHYLGELVLTTRPRWDYGDPEAPEEAAPRHNFSWFLWSKNCRLDGTGRMWWPAKQWFSYMPKGFKP